MRTGALLRLVAPRLESRGVQFRDEAESNLCSSQRKTRGQQLKGKISSALFRTFWQFSTLFQSFSELFLQDFLLELRGSTAVLVQR